VKIVAPNLGDSPCQNAWESSYRKAEVAKKKVSWQGEG
ncbi:hypothetical protein CCACVL1_24983, partial [Corchorus capsularis]